MEDFIMANLPVRAPLDMQSQNITNLLDPVDPQDGATRQFVLDNAGGGGTFGNFEFNAPTTGIAAGAQVGNAVTNASVTIDASANIIHAVPFPAGLVDRTDYVFRVTAAVTGLPLGDYLAQYREAALSGADIWFNFRPLVNGIAGTPLDFTTGGTFTGFGYTAFEEGLAQDILQLLNNGDDPASTVFEVNANNGVDFTVTPSVNDGLLASDEEVRQVFDRLEYEIEHIDPFTPLPHEDGYVYTADSGVTGICLLYTSPSPRDS